MSQKFKFFHDNIREKLIKQKGNSIAKFSSDSQIQMSFEHLYPVICRRKLYTGKSY